MIFALGLGLLGFLGRGFRHFWVGFVIFRSCLGLDFSRFGYPNKRVVNKTCSLTTTIQYCRIEVQSTMYNVVTVIV
jgi:hypothetical protein